MGRQVVDIGKLAGQRIAREDMAMTQTGATEN